MDREIREGQVTELSRHEQQADPAIEPELGLQPDLRPPVLLVISPPGAAISNASAPAGSASPPAQQIIQHISSIQNLLREHLPSQTLRITLHPEGLGAVDVAITRRADTVLVTLKADVQDTLASLQADSDVLETALFASEGLRPVVQFEAMEKPDASLQDNGNKAFSQRGDTGLGGNSPQPQQQSRRTVPALPENLSPPANALAATDVSHPQLRAGTALYL
jgi:hypothetical protein